MSSQVSVQRNTATALVVDREAQVRSLAKSILSGVGFRVAESEDGQNALPLLRAKPCLDLLVTDTQPPGVDGRMLAETFMVECPLARIVLLSDNTEIDGINIESTGAWVFLPKQRLAEVLVDAIKGLGLAHPQRVILVAEDDPLLRNLVQAILTKAGHAVITAADGEEALQLSRAYGDRIDLLISDIMMPRMNGSELAEHIRRERPEIRILLMSGHASGVLLEYAKKRNFLAKPFGPQKLIDRVSQLLNRPPRSDLREKL